MLFFLVTILFCVPCAIIFVRFVAWCCEKYVDMNVKKRKKEEQLHYITNSSNYSCGRFNYEEYKESVFNDIKSNYCCVKRISNSAIIEATFDNIISMMQLKNSTWRYFYRYSGYPLWYDDSRRGSTIEENESSTISKAFALRVDVYDNKHELKSEAFLVPKTEQDFKLLTSFMNDYSFEKKKGVEEEKKMKFEIENNKNIEKFLECAKANVEYQKSDSEKETDKICSDTKELVCSVENNLQL